MSITPIKEAALLSFAAPQPKEKSEGGDFMQAFAGAKDAARGQETAAAPAGKSAKGKDPADNSDKGGMEAKPAADKSADNKTVKTENKPAEKSAGTERPAVKQEAAADKTVNDTPVSDVTAEETAADPGAEAAVSVMTELMNLLAGMLDMTPEELASSLEELGISGAELFETGAANILTAGVLADGDMSALVTDGSLRDLAADMGAAIEEALASIKEELPGLDEDSVKELLAGAGDKLAASPQIAEKPEQKPELKTDAAVKEEAPVIQGSEEETGPFRVAEEGTQNNKNNAAAGEKENGAEEKTPGRREIKEDRFDLDAAGNDIRPEGKESAEIRPEDIRPEAEQLRYLSSPEEILEQVTTQIRTQVREDMTSIDMLLNPASLGHVALNVTSKDGSVTAQLTAQSEAVKEALESQLVVLKQNLEQAGVKVTAVEVTVSSHAFEENLEQGNNGQSDAEAQERERLRRATRKIDLGEYGVEGEPADDADAVTVDMMRADGNRMDYRA
ncbi:MAG: flagellar hook-length control protein FliK [Lachnospiraceae bacterium]|nr:flagellar hook-length control protein FliK [Lachnospiraceae bacterium]